MVEHGKMKELDHHEKAQEMGKHIKKSFAVTDIRRLFEMDCRWEKVQQE